MQVPEIDEGGVATSVILLIIHRTILGPSIFVFLVDVLLE